MAEANLERQQRPAGSRLSRAGLGSPGRRPRPPRERVDFICDHDYQRGRERGAAPSPSPTAGRGIHSAGNRKAWGGEGWGPREGTGARSAFSPPSPLPGRRAEPTSRGLCPVQFVQCKSPGACQAPLRGGGRWGRGGVLFCFLLPFTSSAWPDPRDGWPYFRHVCGQDQLALHSGAAPKPLLPASPTGG